VGDERATGRLLARVPTLQRQADALRLRGWRSPGAVYVNTVAPSTLRLLGAVDRNATVVVHVHELEAALRYGIADADRRALWGRADHVVAASQAVADNLVANHGVAADRVRVHHEFVTPVPPVAVEDRRAARRRRGLPEDAFLVGGSGMLEWRKAPELFVRLAADLRARVDRELAFVWVGGTDHGPLWAPLDHEARHLGVEDVVRFVGAQDDPGDWFRLLDAFALTSREDAFPLAALEAASAGVPVVSFATGGMVELEGVEAVRYPDTEAVADVLAGWVADEGGRSARGRGLAEVVRARHLTEVGAPRLWADLATWVRG
jgi:glycosyltransferase involved in cell wall biosynthesis